ncbi:MAG TPA: cobalamin-binding protein [Candidatus Atribacteria bacterium]|nr:cobalamin-binding protein [Candidatus Atribacteria bacterium]
MAKSNKTKGKIAFFLVGMWLLVFSLSFGVGAKTLSDDSGREVEVPSSCERIISLSPSNTEIVFALSLAEKLVGVTTYCNYPEEAKEKEKVGTLNEINLEKVVELEPDLVLASSLTPPDVVERLGSLGITVFVLDPHNINEVMEDIEKVGIIAGVEARGKELRKAMEEDIREVREKVSHLSPDERPTVFHLIWHEPLWTAGGDTFINEFITIAGGKNAVADLSGYVTLDLEEFIRRNPDIITVVENHGDAENLPYQFLLSDGRLQVVKAIQEHKVFPVDADIVSRSSARVVDAIHIFARILHPEIFGEYEYEK